MLANAFAHVLSTPSAIAEADMRTRKHRSVGLVLISLMSLSPCRKSDKKTPASSVTSGENIEQLLTQM